MVQGIGDAIANAMLVLMLIAAVVGGAVVGLVFWGLPLAWEWIKPWLHVVTA